MKPEMQERSSMPARLLVVTRLGADERPAQDGNPHQQDDERGKRSLQMRMQQMRNGADQHAGDQPPQPRQDACSRNRI